MTRARWIERHWDELGPHPPLDVPAGAPPGHDWPPADASAACANETRRDTGRPGVRERRFRSSMEAHMRAVLFNEYGGPDVLHVGEAAEPHAGAGQVRVAVRAIGVNPIDWKVRSGAMAQFIPVEFP